ncbi:MAG: hemerythrin domain-containing protein, partial [Vicinamibacterales bacterium]|nr:hemerythrin domain-containing protein [Vicinamibacterales bacterium]
MDRLTDSARPLDVLCVDIVQRYHASLRRSLPRIRDELAALCASGSSPELSEVRIAFSDLGDLIARHLAKEEHLLFPALEELAAADRDNGRRPATPFVTVLHPIRLMETEHARIEAAVERLRDLAVEVQEPESVMPAWQRCLAELAALDHELHEHHRSENEILFPLALEIE